MVGLPPKDQLKDQLISPEDEQEPLFVTRADNINTSDAEHYSTDSSEHSLFSI